MFFALTTIDNANEINLAENFCDGTYVHKNNFDWCIQNDIARRFICTDKECVWVDKNE